MTQEKVIDNVFLQRCSHSKFKLNDSLDRVFCGICGEGLNPMWVIKEFSNKEHRLFERLMYLEKQAKKAEEKNRCKCEKCGQMTTIQKQ